jgi:Rod binding domain-containing protein
MDSIKLILTTPVLPPVPLEHLIGTLSSEKTPKPEPAEINSISEENKKQIAKDFESVLLSRLLDEMKNTIGDWGFDKDGASEQIQGIFWLYLARDIANKGGFGMWKDIYQFLTNSNQTNVTTESPDRKDSILL